MIHWPRKGELLSCIVIMSFLQKRKMALRVFFCILSCFCFDCHLCLGLVLVGCSVLFFFFFYLLLHGDLGHVKHYFADFKLLRNTAVSLDAKLKPVNSIFSFEFVSATDTYHIKVFKGLWWNFLKTVFAQMRIVLLEAYTDRSYKNLV